MRPITLTYAYRQVLELAIEHGAIQARDVATGTDRSLCWSAQTLLRLARRGWLQRSDEHQGGKHDPFAYVIAEAGRAQLAKASGARKPPASSRVCADFGPLLTTWGA